MTVPTIDVRAPTYVVVERNPLVRQDIIEALQQVAFCSIAAFDSLSKLQEKFTEIEPVHTIFVDDMPDTAVAAWLMSIASACGARLVLTMDPPGTDMLASIRYGVLVRPFTSDMIQSIVASDHGPISHGS